MHCRIWNWCIVRFVHQIYCYQPWRMWVNKLYEGLLSDHINKKQNTSEPCAYQGSHRSGKSQEKVKSQEKSVNFHMGQEILKFTKKSGKMEWIMTDHNYFMPNDHHNISFYLCDSCEFLKKSKYPVFILQKVSKNVKIVTWSGKSQEKVRKFHRCDLGEPCIYYEIFMMCDSGFSCNSSWVYFLSILISLWQCVTYNVLCLGWLRFTASAMLISCIISSLSGECHPGGHYWGYCIGTNSLSHSLIQYHCVMFVGPNRSSRDDLGHLQVIVLLDLVCAVDAGMERGDSTSIWGAHWRGNSASIWVAHWRGNTQELVGMLLVYKTVLNSTDLLGVSNWPVRYYVLSLGLIAPRKSCTSSHYVTFEIIFCPIQAHDITSLELIAACSAPFLLIVLL